MNETERGALIIIIDARLHRMNALGINQGSGNISLRWNEACSSRRPVRPTNA